MNPQMGSTSAAAAGFIHSNHIQLQQQQQQQQQHQQQQGGNGGVNNGSDLKQIHQQQQQQQQRLNNNQMMKQQNQQLIDPMSQQQQQTYANLAQFHNLTLDPSLLAFGTPIIKQELDLDSANPFSLNVPSDFGDLASVLSVSSPMDLSSFQDHSSLVSPLSSSPFDANLSDDYFSRSLGSSFNSLSRFQPPTPANSAPQPSSMPLMSTSILQQALKNPSAANSNAQGRATLQLLQQRSMDLMSPNITTRSAGVTKKSPNITNVNAQRAALAPNKANTSSAASPNSMVESPAATGPGNFFSISMPVQSSNSFAQLDAANRLAFGTGPSATSTTPVMTQPPHLMQQQSQPQLSSSVGASTASTSSSSTPASTRQSSARVGKSAAAAVASLASSSVVVDEEDNNEPKTSDVISERRRRRRESHNAVERRRRDNINEKIQELATLLPEYPDAQNKGSILRRSVEYVKMMQALATRQQERMRELEGVCQLLLQRCGMQEQELLLTVPLGTVFELPQISGVTIGGMMPSTPGGSFLDGDMMDD